MTNANAQDPWEEALHPDIVRDKLLSASMYITAFEILKDSVVDRVRNVYTSGWNGSGEIIEPAYQTEVLSRNRSTLHASLDWLQEHGVFAQSDLTLFEAVKAVRNTLAHELHAIATSQVQSTHVESFPDVIGLLRKIEVWWIVNFEVPSNPDFDGVEVDVDGIVPGPVLSLQVLVEVASGNKTFYEHFRERREQQLNGNPDSPAPAGPAGG